MAVVLRQALLIASKDTRIFFKDKFAMAFAFLFPFIFIVGWSAALSGQGQQDDLLDITLVTRESVGISVGVIEELERSTYASVGVMDYDEASTALESGEIDGFVVFPGDFTQSIASGERTSLEVVVGDDAPEAEAALTGFAQEVAGRFTETQIAIPRGRRAGAAPAGRVRGRKRQRRVTESPRSRWATWRRQLTWRWSGWGTWSHSGRPTSRFLHT